MKKSFSVLAICVTVLLTLLIGGCGISQQTETMAPDVKAIYDRGELNVGVKSDVPRFGCYDDETNTIDGFEVDIARAISNKIFGNPDKINLQGVTSKTRGPLLENDQLDLVIATFTITDERKKIYNFSKPYYTDGVGMMVKKNSGIKSINDLNGKTIGVVKGTTSRKAIQDVVDKYAIKVQFAESGTYPELKEALTTGRIDVFSVDTAILYGYLDDSTDILKDHFSQQNYGIACKKSNTGLAELIDKTIAEMKQNGEMDKLLQKWGLK